MSVENPTPDQGFPATWYRVRRYMNEIEPVVVKKATAKFVSFYDAFLKRDRREKREGYFETWGAAHAHLLERCEQRLKHAETELQQARSELGKVKSMVKP